MREKVTRLFPNATITVSQYMQDNLEEMTSGVKGENAVKIFGEDLAELDRLAREVKEKIQKVPGVEDVGIFRELGQPNLLIEVNRENASAVGLSVAGGSGHGLRSPGRQGSKPDYRRGEKVCTYR